MDLSIFVVVFFFFSVTITANLWSTSCSFSFPYPLFLILLQVYTAPPGFACPWVPALPAICIFFNIFLFAQVCLWCTPLISEWLFHVICGVPQFIDKNQYWQHMNLFLTACLYNCVLSYYFIKLTSDLIMQLHYEAWVRFVVLSIISIGVYAFYGQFHANPVSENETIVYHRAPTQEAQ